MSRHSRTTTERRTATRREVLKALRKTELTHEEELVLRMRMGLSEPGSTTLEYRGQQNEELSAKLALIEAEALDRVRPRVVVPLPLEGKDLKRAIVDKLKRI